MMNIEEIFKKFEKKPLDWDQITYSTEQVKAGSPDNLIATFNHYHIETVGQSHNVGLFKKVAEDGGEIYYATPGSIMSVNKFTGSTYLAHPCERPDKDSVEIVSGSATDNYERFWE